MEKSLAIMAALLLWTGCELLDSSFGVQPRGGRTTTSSGYRRDTSSQGGHLPPDTVVWACAVKVPESYDWRRDGASGQFGGELLLYRDYSPVLIIGLGTDIPISPSPGTHHLAGGHLYTECCSGGKTFICRDGQAFLTFDEECFLKDLAEDGDGNLFTLACRPGDGGLVLRRNAEVLLRTGRGRTVGGFGEGWKALYFDGRMPCFSYTDGDSFYSVRDGIATAVLPPVSGATVEDVRYAGWETLVLFKKDEEQYLSRDGIISRLGHNRANLHFMEHEGELIACGYSDYGVRKSLVAISPDGGRREYMKTSDSWAFCAGGMLFGVQSGSPLTVSRASSDPHSSPEVFSSEELFLFTEECVGSCGAELLLGASSSKGGRPRFIRGSRAVGELPFNGYITAVDVQIIPPS